ADGYLITSAAGSDLVAGIRAVWAGEIYVTPKLVGAVLRRLRDGRGDRTGLESLSPREFELLRLLAAGRRLKDAAGVLNVSTSTASTYRSRLMEKLQVSSTAELIRFALEHDITG
ncbi:MAG: response regulator transcription factor, partial [Myxococcota bacterium]|nr:response regulator transcription factor [Myxococcota bacterium]